MLVVNYGIIPTSRRLGGVDTQLVDRFSVIARLSRNPEELPGWHAMLFSYFDDSSDEQHRRYFASGGLVGSEAQWAELHEPWALATANLKKPFRSTDCETQHDQFEGWEKPACDALMARLVSIIVDLELHGFGSIVPIADYKSVFPKSGEYDAYYLAVRHTIINMAELAYRGAQKDPNVTMDCWFEESKATAGTISRLYGELRDVESWSRADSLKTLHTDKGKELHQLQAADLVAREAFKHFDNQGSRPTRKPVARMNNLLYFIVWRREHLEYLRDNGGPNDLELLTSWGKSGRSRPPDFENYWRNYVKA